MVMSCDNGDVIASPDGRKKHEKLSKFRISNLTQRPLQDRGVDRKDLIGQACEF